MVKQKVQTLTSPFRFLFIFVLSVLISGFARPSDLPIASLMAATFGYAIFWKALSQQTFSRLSKLTWVWLLYFCSSLIQTRWLLSHPFLYIIGIWVFLASLLSIPYALCTRNWMEKDKSPIFLASCFALVDMLEPHLFFCGISFRSIGSFLMATTYTSELITILGGAGLTFLVILANGMVYKLLQKKTSPTQVLSTFFFFLLLGGLIHKTLPTTTTHTPIKVAIIHWNTTALLNPTNQDLYDTYRQNLLKITCLIPELKKESPDLIVLPEGAFPYSLETRLLPRYAVPSELQQHMSENSSFVRTQDIFSALALETKSDILIGLERNEKNLFYNSCFLFSPDGSVDYYDKRVLVPGGEYIPLEEIFKPLLNNYGITGSFQQGEEAKVLHNKSIRLLPLICYEETLAQYVRSAAILKPDLLVSLSNDHWFPTPLFARDHWLLGKMRAMESGIPLIRCTNMGQSGIILADGQEIARSQSPMQEELMIIQMDPEQRTTLYSLIPEAIIALFFLGLLLSNLKTCLVRLP